MLYISENSDKLGKEFLSASMKYMSLQRIRKTDSLRVLSDKVNSAAVYLMLLYALKREYGIYEPVEFIYGKYGKPYLKEHPDIFFNLSHCRNSCVCILSDKETAVDIADIRKINMRTAKYFCSEEEYKAAELLDDPNEMLVSLWSKKECCSKLDGRGMSLIFRNITGDCFDGIRQYKGDRYYCSYYAENDLSPVMLNSKDLLDI